MNITRTGLILNTENYDECVAFYRDVFNLTVMFEKTDGDFKLTCLEFGSSYLMIETDGLAKPSGKSIKENCTKIRFNVANLDESLIKIKSHGIDAVITKNSWGDTINIYDPDGNRVGIRDEASFQ